MRNCWNIFHKTWLLAVISFMLIGSYEAVAEVNSKSVKIGAYYFDGWTGKTNHVSETLRSNYQERMPVWGWKTSTPEVIEQQIDLASDAGLSFFSFCWYFGKSKTDHSIVDQDPKNNALKLYLQSSNRNKLDFNLMIANHQGYIFTKSDWPFLCQTWIKLFKENGYVTVEGKPLIIFFSGASLLKTFGNEKQVSLAFEELKRLAISQGLKGVTIAINASTLENAKLAGSLGTDLITGYNYHNEGLRSGGKEVVPIENMQASEKEMWRKLSQINNIIPTATLNWDKRPAEKMPNDYSPRFSGYSGNSIRNSVSGMIKWMRENNKVITKEKIALLYAWNEYAEGAWLTPSEKFGSELLKGLKEGIRK